MNKKYQEKIKELEKQKKIGEEVVYIPKISAKPQLLLFLSIAIISFVCGRVFYDKIYVLLLTNLISMWMMVDVARAMIGTQESCILITNKRIYGKIDQREINIYYRDIKEVHNSRQGIFIETKNVHNRAILRYVLDRDEAYQTIRNHVTSD